MENYAQLDNNKVICISILSSKVTKINMIELEEYNPNLLGSMYENGVFVGYETKLVYENGKVTANVWDWLTESILSNFSDTIIFDCEGEQIEVQAIDGVATIDIQVEVGTETIVKTANQNFRNGEVVVYG